MSQMPVFTVRNAQGPSPIVLVCEHAANHIPPEYGTLGLAPAELTRHIAWDPGAAALAQGLSEALDAPLFCSAISRLVIDCNRPPGVPSSIPERSEATDIPGNRGLDATERQRRVDRYFTPFQAAIAAHLDQRQAEARPTVVVGVHSFTPVFLGEARPWHAGILYIAAEKFARTLVTDLALEPGLVVGDNQPYRSSPDTDYTVSVHGDNRGLPAVLLEVRQDLLATAAGVAEWTGRLTRVLDSKNVLF